MNDPAPPPGPPPNSPRLTAAERMRQLQRRLRPRTRPRFSGLSFNRMIPNILTMLGLCAGLTSMRFALEGRFAAAAVAIIVAACIDGLDGRLARLLKATSRFGAEFDSLADFVCFGVVPVIILYRWGLSDLGNVGWIAVLVFAMCAALRLARFNVMLEDPDRPEFAGNFFVGVPAPAAALVVMLPAYLEFLGIPQSFPVAIFALVFVLAIALLMVSRIPTWSGKKMGARVPRDYVLAVFVLVVLLVALLISFPWAVLAFGSLLYLAAIPFAYAHHKRLERAHMAAPVAGGEAVLPPSPENEDRPGRLN
jgi:CDP-diacylglycerol---serine O-phosphatidyltransferase